MTGGPTTTAIGLSALMPVSPVSSITVVMEGRLSTLEIELRLLEDQLMISKVDLGGQVFNYKYSIAA